MWLCLGRLLDAFRILLSRIYTNLQPQLSNLCYCRALALGVVPKRRVFAEAASASFLLY